MPNYKCEEGISTFPDGCRELEARVLPVFLDADVPGWRRCHPESAQNDPRNLKEAGRPVGRLPLLTSMGGTLTIDSVLIKMPLLLWR